MEPSVFNPDGRKGGRDARGRLGEIIEANGVRRAATTGERVRETVTSLQADYGLPAIFAGSVALGAVAGGPLGAALGAYGGYLVIKHVVIDWRAPP